MFRDDKYPKSKTSVNCTITGGGLGDLLCYLVSVNYILTNLPWINLLIWVPDNLVDFAKNVLPSENNRIRGYSEAHRKYDKELPGLTTAWNGRTSPMRMHAVDYGYSVLVDKAVDIHHKNYLKLKLETIDTDYFNLPEKYVVVQAYSREKVKRLPSHVINNIARYSVIKGYKVIFLGQKEETIGDIDFSLGMDLTNKTNLLEAGKIIAGAKAFIGMDSGLTHLAGFTDTSIIAGYTLASPDHLMPYRSNTQGFNCYPIVPDESLGCKFCQTNMPLLYGIDYRDCYYKDFLMC